MNKGGYYLINKNDANIYEKCVLAITQGKPILWYEDDITAYYIDTMSGGEVTSEIIDDEEVFTYGDVILTKGGKTITITYENVVTETGSIQQTTENFDALMENIVDSDGNKRFVDINLQPVTIEGVSNIYTKGLLSGTHLMLVVCGEIANGTTLTGGTDIARINNLPAYISDKIVNFYGDAYVDIKGVTLYNGTSVDSTKTIGLREVSDNNYVLRLISSVSATADLKFRMQFDLLIDAEYSE